MPRASALCAPQAVERGRIVVRQLAAHLRRHVPHLPLDRFSGVGPDAVEVGIVRRLQQVASASERSFSVWANRAQDTVDFQGKKVFKAARTAS